MAGHRQAAVRRSKQNNSMAANSITPKVTTNSERGRLQVNQDGTTFVYDKGYSPDKFEVRQGSNSDLHDIKQTSRDSSVAGSPSKQKGLSHQLNNINIIIDRPAAYVKHQRPF
mmetsp:Transcript_34251/g.52519  ORF Transcript_34251/g.52519 Transcript_34251/m.52519 type:complete len:113 (+) Transcript_34251:116-454(+)